MRLEFDLGRLIFKSQRLFQPGGDKDLERIAQSSPRWLTVFRWQGKIFAIDASCVLPRRLNHCCENEPSNVNFAVFDDH